MVDVSFNQLGGLFTLNFLEEVDLAIGGDHIFKRAIMLVRARRACSRRGHAASNSMRGRSGARAGAAWGCARAAAKRAAALREQLARRRRRRPRAAQVKAWCYYESRLLGAHHGLISTYALETLVLYVFNKHHALRPITSPLQVRGRARSGPAVAAIRSRGLSC